MSGLRAQGFTGLPGDREAHEIGREVLIFWQKPRPSRVKMSKSAETTSRGHRPGRAHSCAAPSSPECRTGGESESVVVGTQRCLTRVRWKGSERGGIRVAHSFAECMSGAQKGAGPHEPVPDRFSVLLAEYPVRDTYAGAEIPPGVRQVASVGATVSVSAIAERLVVAEIGIDDR